MKRSLYKLLREQFMWCKRVMSTAARAGGL